MCGALRSAWDLKTVWAEDHMDVKDSGEAGSEQGEDKDQGSSYW